MKRNLICVIIFILFCFIYMNSYAVNFFEPNEGPQCAIRLSILPLGYFVYAADAGSHYNYFSDPFREAYMAFEYRPFNLLGFEFYGYFKGYAWSEMDTPYAFVNFWGVPGFKIGAAAVYHMFNSDSIFDLYGTFGLEWGLFWENEIDIFHGLGIGVSIGFAWRPVPWIGFGITGATHWARHTGGPSKTNPGSEWYPFELSELSAGLSCNFYF